MTSPFRPRYKGIHLDGFRIFYQNHPGAFRQVAVTCRDGRVGRCLETREGKLVYMDEKPASPSASAGQPPVHYVRVATDQERKRGGDLLLHSSHTLLSLLEPEKKRPGHRRPAPDGLLCARRPATTCATGGTPERLKAPDAMPVTDPEAQRVRLSRCTLQLLPFDAGDSLQHQAHIHQLHRQILAACNQFLADQCCATEQEEQEIRHLYYAALVDYGMGIFWAGSPEGKPAFDRLEIDGRRLSASLSSGTGQSRLRSWLLAARIHVRRHRRTPEPVQQTGSEGQQRRMRQELAAIMCFCRRQGITAAHLACWYQQSAGSGSLPGNWAVRFEHLVFGSNRLMPFARRAPANEEERARKLRDALVQHSAGAPPADSYRPRHGELLPTVAGGRAAAHYLPGLLQERARLSGCAAFVADSRQFGQWLAQGAMAAPGKNPAAGAPAADSPAQRRRQAGKAPASSPSPLAAPDTRQCSPVAG